jgi:hypothetical protein
MFNPTLYADGQTYEHDAIEAWLMERQESPMTRETLMPGMGVPNLALRGMIRNWHSDHGMPLPKRVVIPPRRLKLHIASGPDLEHEAGDPRECCWTAFFGWSTSMFVGALIGQIMVIFSTFGREGMWPVMRFMPVVSITTMIDMFVSLIGVWRVYGEGIPPGPCQPVWRVLGPNACVVHVVATAVSWNMYREQPSLAGLFVGLLLASATSGGFIPPVIAACLVSRTASAADAPD